MNSLSHSYNANTAAQQLLTMITSQNSPKNDEQNFNYFAQKFLIKVKTY